jgi:hypothetical protein
MTLPPVARGYHRGRYHTDKPRRTLMFTYTGAPFSTFDYFSDQPWVLQEGYLDSLSPGGQAFFGAFAQTFGCVWCLWSRSRKTDSVWYYYCGSIRRLTVQSCTIVCAGPAYWPSRRMRWRVLVRGGTPDSQTIWSSFMHRRRLWSRVLRPSCECCLVEN